MHRSTEFLLVLLTYMHETFSYHIRPDNTIQIRYYDILVVTVY